MRLFVPIALLLAFCCASTAAGFTGVESGPSDVAPPDAQRLGALCRADTATVRLWWSETSGSLGALAGDADGRCRTVPAAVRTLARTAVRARARARVLGFPAMLGDAPPPVLRSRSLTRSLMRLTPERRGRTLLRIRARDRGAFLAGFTTSSRKRLLRGMPVGTRRRLQRDARAALRGVPGDFVGGDRRVDVVVDASSATGRVDQATPAMTVCSLRRAGARSPRRVFSHAHVIVLADGEQAPTAELAHELFHVVQCNLAVNAAAPDLLLEGTAEWFAGLVDPSGFAPPPATGPDGVATLRGGSGRVASFCSGFDPTRAAGLHAYNSWGVWSAIGQGKRPARAIRASLLAFRGRTARTSPGELITALGATRWVNATLTATRSLCGELSAPFSGLRFPAEIRPFFGAGGPSVTLGATQPVVVPAWGVRSVVARWGMAPGAVVRLRAAGVDPALLASSIVAMTPDGPQSVVVRGDAAEVALPPDTEAQALVVTIANPLPGTPLGVDVAVVEAVPGAAP